MTLRFKNVPDEEMYNPRFSPWLGYGDFARYDALAQPLSLTAPESRYTLFSLAQQALGLGGEIWECGVFKGGTARMLAALIAENGATKQNRLRLFDTFQGSPGIDAIHDIPYGKRDLTPEDLKPDLCLDVVRERVGNEQFISYHPGVIPVSFRDLENSQIAFAHVDVDLYRGVKACCEFIYPRMQTGGFMLFDDYGYPSCPGARKAVDDFFADKPETPLVSPSAQAIVFKAP